MRFFAVALFFFGAASYGQTPEVPHKMQFAGMTLTIRDDARREIQKDVDALTQHPRYFNIKVERAKTYFPIIEKIFAEERLPDDFKYLALQESALISDAVSFWQFKDFTAEEMGLRVDKEVDERMNLVSASRAAAKYLKQNNYMFNNWLYALQSYQMGAGGVQRAVGDQHNGAKHMAITSETYWYVKKYIAHKVAFENAVTGEAQLKVVPFETSAGKSLSEIALEMSVEVDRLTEFNKWAKNGKIPYDKSYTVLIPVGNIEDFNKLMLASSSVSKSGTKITEPIKSAEYKKQDKLEVMLVNEIPVVKARPGETLAGLADRAQTDLSSFLKYNDISVDHKLQVGALYFLDKKKTKSKDEFYKVGAGEDVWTISQRTGVQLKRLNKYNEFDDFQKVEAGSIVWLSGPKPKIDVMPATDAVALVDEESEFEWKVEEQYAQSIQGDKSVKKDSNVGMAATSGSISGNTTVKTTLEYTVKPGETLYWIAKENQVEIVDILSWNNLTINDGVKTGQLLKLYDPTSVVILPGKMESQPLAQVNSSQPDEELVHEVQATDTLYSVAKKYGVTIKDLMNWNEKTDLSLTVGEKLRIMQR
jgi:membrane-bound lytic murein transglycosylase D